MKRAGKLVALAALPLFGLAACDLSRPISAPTEDIPPAWTAPVAGDAALWPSPTWWQAFGEPELDTLIADAKARNLDLDAAFYRVLQAEAQARIAGAPLLPAVDLGSDANRRYTRAGDNADNGSSSGSNRSGGSRTTSTTGYAVNLGAGYEIDFWGKNRAALQSAEASLAASRYDRETVALTVTTGVATSYFQVLSLRDRLAVAARNLDNAERVLTLVEARVRNGAASPLDLAQQRAQVAQQRAAIPPLEQQEREARAVLAILLGRAPQGFAVAGTGTDTLLVPQVAPGLPSALLARRPDIRQAEAQIAAATANVTAARAAFFPSIELTGIGGLESAALSALFSGPGLILSLGASLTLPIFNAGRLEGEQDAAIAREQELVQTYRATLLGAFRDVENALGQGASFETQERLVSEQAEQARLASELARLRYREGAEDLITVLDAERSLYQVEDQLAQVKLARLQAAVALYKALGGGWIDDGTGPLSAPRV